MDYIVRRGFGVVGYFQRRPRPADVFSAMIPVDYREAQEMAIAAQKTGDTATEIALCSVTFHLLKETGDYEVGSGFERLLSASFEQTARMGICITAGRPAAQERPTPYDNRIGVRFDRSGETWLSDFAASTPPRDLIRFSSLGPMAADASGYLLRYLEDKVRD